jgi:hypothetical protein
LPTAVKPHMRGDAWVPTTFNSWIRAELTAIQRTRESKTKGQRLEALLARVLCSIRGITLEDQDVENAYDTEEIDLYFWNDRARDGLHFLDCSPIVECKAWSRPVSGRELRTFATLLRDKGRSSGIFVALEGIAGNVLQRSAGFFHLASAMAGGQTVLVVTGADLKTADSPADLVRLLRRRMLDQVKGQVLAIESSRHRGKRNRGSRI